MQWIDYAVLGIILVSTIISAFRGLFKEILSLLAWAVAFWVAMKFYKPLTQFITFTDDQSIRVVIALFGLFMGTLMIIGFVNYITTLIFKKTGLSGTDRVLGLIFGLLRGLAIVLVMACTLQLAFNYGFLLKCKEESWYKQSMLMPDVMKSADELLKTFGLGDAGKNFNLFESLKSGVHKDVGDILESDGAEELSPENDSDAASNPAGDTVETTPKK